MIKRFAIAAVALLTAFCSLACKPVAPAPTGAEAAQATQIVVSTDGEPAGTAEAPQSTAQAEDDAFYVVDFNDAYATAGKQQIFETAASVYYLCSPSASSSMIYFSDKEYKDWLPLCSKPECSHRTGDCNACIEGNTACKMWLYGRHIYYCVSGIEGSDLSLWRMKLDGSDHEKLLTCSTEGCSTVYWVFHNKYLFLTFVRDIPETEEINKELFCIDLSRPDIKMVEYGITDENGAPADLPMVVIGQGDKLYCLSNDGENIVYCLDIPTATIKTICRLPADPGPLCTALYDDTLQFCLAWDLGKIINVDINTGEQTVINEAEPQTEKWFHPYRRYIFGSSTSRSLNPSLKGTAVYDMNGELLTDIPYDSYNTDIIISFILGDYAFGHDYYADGANSMGETPQWYLDLNDIGTDRLMWRRWEP